MAHYTASRRHRLTPEEIVQREDDSLMVRRASGKAGSMAELERLLGLHPGNVSRYVTGDVNIPKHVLARCRELLAA